MQLPVEAAYRQDMTGQTVVLLGGSAGIGLETARLARASGTSGRRPGIGRTLIGALTLATQALVANLAVELAPIRANVIAAGFVDTPLSASLLGDQLEARRAELRTTLPVRRVVAPADIAALAIHLMTNTAVTGATATASITWLTRLVALQPGRAWTVSSSL